MADHSRRLFGPELGYFMATLRRTRWVLRDHAHQAAVARKIPQEEIARVIANPRIVSESATSHNYILWADGTSVVVHCGKTPFEVVTVFKQSEVDTSELLLGRGFSPAAQREFLDERLRAERTASRRKR